VPRSCASFQSSRNKFNKYGSQLIDVPSVHWDATAITLAGTSSLRHFLSNFQAKIFAPNCVVALLIHLMMIPLVPLSVSYFFFIYSTISFSLVLSSKNNAGSIPWIGNLVRFAIRSIVMGMVLSIHITPPCLTSNNYVMHVIAYWPLPKCGRSNRPKIPIFSIPVPHWYV
jgi:hypothetical protein